MRLLAGFGLLANAVTLFLFDPPTPQTKMLQMEKTFVLMTILSFLIENQALEWQDRSEEDGTSFQFCGPKRRYVSHLILNEMGLRMRNMWRRNSKRNVFDWSKTTFFKNGILFTWKSIICSLSRAWVKSRGRWNGLRSGALTVRLASRFRKNCYQWLLLQQDNLPSSVNCSHLYTAIDPFFTSST